ncbi:hypothetical protein pEaSNUABM29_00124 [Erwinia phage pEa_SNUABM_29]|nr:hypothetical protein pEaSNUABM29_00124 [Erwinia phage pEa_SNUABM_29]
MSRRKKKPAYNPRKLARDSVVSSMKDLLKRQAVFVESGSFLSGRVDREREVVGAIDHVELKEYTLEALDRAQAALIGMGADVTPKFNQMVVEMDAIATPLVALLDDHTKSWKDIKDQVTMDQLSMSNIEQASMMLSADFNYTSIELFSRYNAEIKFVKQALNKGQTMDQAKALLAQAIADQAKEVQPAPVDHHDVEVKVEEAANV